MRMRWRVVWQCVCGHRFEAVWRMVWQYATCPSCGCTATTEGDIYPVGCLKVWGEKRKK